MIKRVLLRGLAGAAAVIGLEAAYAILRPAPKLEEFDPSATYGADDLPPLRIAALGDSTITSPGVAGPHEIWISRVCQSLGESFHVTLQSYAVGGSMAHNLVESQLQPALDFDPDLVFISVGANDALKGVAPSRFAQNLDILVSAFRDTGAAVVQSGVGDLGTIPRLLPPLRHLLSRRAMTFNDIHLRVAESRGSFVVPHRDSPVAMWRGDRDLWSSDLFHVSARGHEVWADLGWTTVQEALRQGSIAG